MIFKRKPEIPDRKFNPKRDITTYELAMLVGYGFGCKPNFLFRTDKNIECYNESLFQSLPDGARRHFDIEIPETKRTTDRYGLPHLKDGDYPDTPKNIKPPKKEVI